MSSECGDVAEFCGSDVSGHFRDDAYIFHRSHGPARARRNRSVDSDLTRNLFHKT